MTKTPTRPEYTEEYKRGYRDFENGILRKNCPFIKDSSSAQLWLRGWDDANEADNDFEQ